MDLVTFDPNGNGRHGHRQNGQHRDRRDLDVADRTRCDLSSGQRDWSGAGPFVAIGTICVVVGGLVAAVTGPTGFEDGSWMAAYLVLVGGTAQIALGVGQSIVGAGPPRARARRTELIGWNIGVIATIAGTLVAEPLLTTIGGLATAVALVAFLTVRPERPQSVGWMNIGYRVLVGVVLVSIPVGVTLAWIRHG